MSIAAIAGILVGPFTELEAEIKSRRHYRGD